MDQLSGAGTKKS